MEFLEQSPRREKEFAVPSVSDRPTHRDDDTQRCSGHDRTKHVLPQERLLLGRECCWSHPRRKAHDRGNETERKSFGLLFLGDHFTEG
jgi:hypothetical protein